MSSPPLRTRAGEPVELVLYKYDSCPYCQRVMRKIHQLGLTIPSRDTREEPGARDELVRVGGKGQVPCLFINGEPLYESADIVRYLETEIGPG